MLDNEIVRIIKPKIEELYQTFYSIDVKFLKGFQRRKVGADSANALYYYTLPNDNIGLPKRDSFYDSNLDEMIYQETQLIDTTFQFNSLVPNGDLTAKDLLNYARIIVYHEDFLSYCNDNGLGVYKPTEIRTGWFNTDNDGYEDNPSFDVTFQHETVTTSTTNTVSNFEHNIERV